MTRILVVYLCFTAIANAAPDEKPVVYKPRFLPGSGIADPTDKVGYFPAVKGGIDAVDLATGKTLWSSDSGSKPLLATDKLVFVQKGKAILILDTAGKLVSETEAIKMPDWVSVEKTYGRSYNYSCFAEEKQFWYSYEASSFYAGGARPSPEIEKAARRDAKGIVAIELENGKITPHELDKAQAGKFLPLEAATKVGEITLTVKDESAKDPKQPFLQKRKLIATKANQAIWEREILAPIFLPPRP